LNEISKNIGITRHFVEKFLMALEKTYVVLYLRPYFTNLGKSIIKTPKLYFIDTGIRNVIFSHFDSLDFRADAGSLIENFVFSELTKRLTYK